MPEQPFQRVMDAIRPLLMGTRNLGDFAARLMDMGLPDTGESALEVVSEGTWKSYSNGSRTLSHKTASALVGRWDSFRFGQNLLESYEEDSLNDLAANLTQIDPSINKGNVPQGLGKLFHEILKAAAGHQDVSLPPGLLAVKRLESGGVPYYDPTTNKIRLGDDDRSLPTKPKVPQTVQDFELGYVIPLVNAYCENQDLAADEPGISDIPPKWAAHFQDQRRAFYMAEWLKDASWNCITNGQAQFEIFLETMYQGVNDTNLLPYASGYERLLKTLAQSTNVQLDGVALADIVDLIDIWSRKGSCHELAAQDRLSWVDPDV